MYENADAMYENTGVIYDNTNSSVYDTGLQGNQVLNRPVPKPRIPRIPRTPSDEKPTAPPIPPPRRNTLPEEKEKKSQCLDCIDSLPSYRKNIEDLIKENRPQKEKFQAACSVMRVQCSLNSKYENIELWNLLERNKDKEVRKIPQAFTILEKYATNLLKDEADRHPSWKSVNFQSNAYQSKVKFMMGALVILKSLGYTEENYNNHGDIVGLSFPVGGSPNSRIVLNIAVDLIIAQFEVEAMIMGEHPRAYELQTIEDVPSVYFPPKNPTTDTITDNEKFGRNNVDYALTKPGISTTSNIYDVPPPIPPKKKPAPSQPPQPVVDYKEQKVKSGSSPQSGSIPQQIKCLECNAVLDGTSKFCNQCGSSLQSRTTCEEVVNTTSQLVEALSIGSEDTFVHVEAGWNCEHCTFLNSYDTNVCGVCCKTPSLGRVNKPEPKAKPKMPKPKQMYDVKPPEEPLLDEGKFQDAKRRRDHELQQQVLKEQQDLEMKKKIIIQEQDKLREDGQLLVGLMKFSENHGYSMEECLLAQKFINNVNEQFLCNWLENDWLNLLNQVVAVCNDNFKNDESVGAMSKGEAKELLLQVDGNKLEVVKAYAEKRKGKINQLADLEKLFGRKNILNALLEADGDDEKARQILHKKQLHVFYQNLHKKLISEDYERLTNENIPKEVKHRMVMAEAGVSWGRSDFVFRLLEKKVPGNTAEIVEVIKDNTYEQCLKYFSRECSICYGDFSRNGIFVNLFCNCEMCWECCSNHIKHTITERHIRYLVCPFCSAPDIEDPEIDTQNYFGMFETHIHELITRGLLEPKIKDIYNKKLLDFHLKKSVNFRYCIKCKNGFEWEDVNQIRMQCDKCKAYMCFLCKQEWMDQHQGISCEQFMEWKEANDPNKQEQGVQDLLHGRGIECPSCKVKFELAQGGCMHFKCTECLFEFCGGCDQPFKRLECKVDVSCAGKGLHTHHPRDCLYFIRDTSVPDLEKLLHNNKVEWKKEYPQEMLDNNKPLCVVKLQIEEGDRLIDAACGKDAPKDMAGLCEKHYKEYLVVLINNNGIDPVEIMTTDELNNVLRRCFIKPELEKTNEESDDAFRNRLLKFVLEKIPLKRRKKLKNRPDVGAQPVGAAAAAAAAAAPAPAPVPVIADIAVAVEVAAPAQLSM